MPCGQQLQLGAYRHEPLAGAEHIADMTGVGSNGSHPDQRPAEQVRMPGLSSRDVEPPPKFSDHRPDQRALLLEGTNVAEHDVQLQGADIHHSPPGLSFLKTTSLGVGGP
jgi:hypothetical protein